MNLGPNTKAAIARIAQHLPHLRSEGTAMPPSSKDEVQAIKQPLSGMPSSNPRDPLINCAEQWVEKLLSEAMEADKTQEPKTAPIAEPKEVAAEPDHSKKHHHKGGK